MPCFEKGEGRSLWPAERPFRKPCGTGGTSRKDFLHNPAGRGPAPFSKEGAFADGAIEKSHDLNGKAFNYSSSSVFCLGAPGSRSFLSSTVSFKN